MEPLLLRPQPLVRQLCREILRSSEEPGREAPTKLPLSTNGCRQAPRGVTSPPLSTAATTWRQVASRAPSRPRANRRAEIPHPTLFATDAEVAAMSPEALHETQVSLKCRKHPEAPARAPPPGGDREAVHGSGEDLVNRFRSSLRPATPRAPAPAPARPTYQEEATTGGATSSATPQEPFLRPWRPEQLPLTRSSERPSTPRPEERSERRVAFDPGGPYPQPAGAADRYQSKERKLAKRLPAGVPLSAIYIDEEGRADMSWRNVPDAEKPPGALRGPGHGQGRGKTDPCR